MLNDILFISDTMTSAYFLFFITLTLVHHSRKFYCYCSKKRYFYFNRILESSQSGYTCETSVTLTCPKTQVIVILEVTYSTECTKEFNSTSIYPPSRCIGYYRERASAQCNGKETCVIDNSPEQRPSFLTGKQANCGFQGQSINVEYSCIPGKFKKI
jgi:hypothetical protein